MLGCQQVTAGRSAATARAASPRPSSSSSSAELKIFCGAFLARQVPVVEHRLWIFGAKPLRVRLAAARRNMVPRIPHLRRPCADVVSIGRDEVDPAVREHPLRHLLRLASHQSRDRRSRHLRQHSIPYPVLQPRVVLLQRGVALRMRQDRRHPAEPQRVERLLQRRRQRRSPAAPPADTRPRSPCNGAGFGAHRARCRSSDGSRSRDPRMSRMPASAIAARTSASRP